MKKTELGIGVMDAKKFLIKNDWDYEKAKKYVRENSKEIYRGKLINPSR